MTKIFALGIATLALTGSAFAAGPYDALPGTDILPKEVVQLSPIVPAMGAHWANPANAPLGPYYCVYQGKIVCLEFMMSQEDFVAGKSWPVLPGMDKLPPVNHVDVGFQPKGHPGFEIPHYDIHLYFLSPEEMAKVTP